MGGSLNLTLHIAKTTLLNTQTCIQTASNNVANADNTNYARQSVTLSTGVPIETNAGWLGTGSQISAIEQQRDEYIEQQLVASLSSKSYYETLESSYTTLETTLYDDGEYGVSDALGDFYDAWESLSQNPDGASEKTLVYQATEDLTAAIQSAYENLSDYASSVDEEINDTADQINDLLTKIADSNVQIKIAEAGDDGTANSLRDLRYESLQELAEIIPISWEENSDGTATVTLEMEDDADNITLVTAGVATSVAVEYSADGVPQINVGGTVIDHEELEGGSLKALKELYDQVGTETADFDYTGGDPNDDPLSSDLTYLDRLNAFTYSLITQVNSCYTAGTVFTGASNPADIAIDSSFTADSINISTGTGTNAALAIVNLQDTSLSALGDSTMTEYLAHIQEQLGLDLDDAGYQADFQEALYTSLQEQQQSVSGVSIDEEMVDLLKFQQIYQAAAKIIEQTSALMDTVIEMV